MKELVFLGEAGPDATIIDCGGDPSTHVEHRAVGLRFDQGPASRIEGFTFTGGWSEVEGGALLLDGASPVIRNCVFVANWSRHAGSAVALTRGSDALVEECVFRENTVVGNYDEHYGWGALYGDSASVPVVRSSSFIGNTAYRWIGPTHYFDGVAALALWGGMVEDCEFTENHLPSGKTARVKHATVTGCRFETNPCSPLHCGPYALVHNCNFVGNVAGGCGGVYAQYSTIEDCIFEDNAAAEGGAVCSLASSITHCLFRANYIGVQGPYSADEGAAIRGDAWTVIRGCTFWGNDGDPGGQGVVSCSGAPGFSLTMESSIVAGPGSLQALYVTSGPPVECPAATSCCLPGTPRAPSARTATSPSTPSSATLRTATSRFDRTRRASPVLAGRSGTSASVARTSREGTGPGGM